MLIIAGYDKHKSEWNCFKTVILGEVMSGKTSLRKTLKTRRSHLTDSEDRTVGVEQDVIYLDENLHTSLYDFGGHNTYEFLHQLCVSNQSIILITVDLPDYDQSKDFAQKVGRWYQTATSRVLQPYILLIGTKTDKCPDEECKIKEKQIMQELERLKKRKNRSIEDFIDALENKLDEVISLLPASEADKARMKEDEEKFVEFVKQHSEQDPDIKAKIASIFEKSAGISELNLMSEIAFNKHRLERQPIIHPQMQLVSSQKLQGIDELRNTMHDIVKRHPDLFPAFQIPITWKAVVDEIKNCQALMTVDKFYQFCKKKGIKDQKEMDSLLQYLRAAGIVFHYRDQRPSSDLQGVVFLNPNWIFKIVGNIYNHFYLSGDKEIPTIKENLKELHLTGKRIEEMFSEFINSGLMVQRMLDYLLLKEHVEKDQIVHVINLLVHLDICCLHSSSEDAESSEVTIYRFPCLLSTNPPEQAQSEWPEKCPDDVNEFQMDVCFNTNIDPPGLFPKWSIRINDHFGKRIDWRSGCIAVLKDSNSKIRIMNHGSPDGGDVHYSLSARVRKGESEEYAEVGNVLHAIHVQLRFLQLQHPYILMDSWAVQMCPHCQTAVERPLDKVMRISPDRQRSKCDHCRHPLILHRYYPNRFIGK